MMKTIYSLMTKYKTRRRKDLQHDINRHEKDLSKLRVTRDLIEAELEILMYTSTPRTLAEICGYINFKHEVTQQALRNLEEEELVFRPDAQRGPDVTYVNPALYDSPMNRLERHETGNGVVWKLKG